MTGQRLPTGAATHGRPESAARAAFRREQQALGAGCDFPGCDRHAELGSRVCDDHILVRLSSTGLLGRRQPP